MPQGSLPVGWILLVMSGSAYGLASAVPAPMRITVGVLGLTLAGALLAALSIHRIRQHLAELHALRPATGMLKLDDPDPARESVTATVDREAQVRNAAAHAAILRAVEQLEAIVHDILDEHAGTDVALLTLHDQVRQLGDMGFLAPDELQTWADALDLRHRLLSPNAATPDLPAVERTLAEIIHLQVTFTDRSHQLRHEAWLLYEDDSCAPAPPSRFELTAEEASDDPSSHQGPDDCVGRSEVLTSLSTGRS